MDKNLLIILLILFGIAIAVLIYFFTRKQKSAVDNSGQAILMMQEQLKEMRQTLQNFGSQVDLKMGDSAKIMQQQFSQSANIIKDVTERLTKLDETNRQVVNFADQLQNLQDILKNPKQRGVFGEYYLDTLLSKSFQPNQYKMQYEFKDGTIVDAALFFGDKIIPIDAKFSLENYNRIVEEKDMVERERLEKLFKDDLKKRIDETAKYIRPQENTTEFAFMFIPAEGIYYDLLVNKVGAIKVNTRDFLDYAVHEKKVHIVSPTTFYVSLQALIVGMRAFAIQESTKEIIKNIGSLTKHLRAYDDYFKKLGSHIGTAVNSYNSAYKEFKKVDKDILKITGQATDIEPLQLDRPKTDEFSEE